MATMCRAIMAKKKSRITVSRGLLLLLALALTAAAGQAQTQAGGTLRPAVSSRPAGKANTIGQGAGPIIMPQDISQLLVEPGDLLTVNVYDTPEFTNSYRVDPDGDLTLPLCGKVHLRGLTLQEAARHVEAALKDGQILNAAAGEYRCGAVCRPVCDGDGRGGQSRARAADCPNSDWAMFWPRPEARPRPRARASGFAMERGRVSRSRRFPMPAVRARPNPLLFWCVPAMRSSFRAPASSMFWARSTGPAAT